MRILITAAAYVLALVVLAPVLFFAVIVLAGPHSSLLPSIVQPAVVIAGWLGLLVAPIAIARMVWRRHSARTR